MCLPALCCYVTVSVASMSHSTCFRFNHTHHVTKELISVCVSRAVNRLLRQPLSLSLYILRSSPTSLFLLPAVTLPF